MPTAVVTLHLQVAGLDDHWDFPEFLHLRVLDITLEYWENPTSTKDVQRGFHNILAFSTSPALEHVRLELRYSSSMTLSMQDMDSGDATTDVYRAQYADLHAVLARPTFSSLSRVTIAPYAPHREGLVSAKDQALKLIDFLRTLFAPWCVRRIVNLVCSVRCLSGSDGVVVVDKGEGPRCVEQWVSSWGHDWEKYLTD